VWAEFWDDEVPDRAAALAYYFLFALFPSLLFLTALVGLFPGQLMDAFMTYVSQVLPPDAASMMHKTLAQIITGAGSGVLSFGAGLALWSASSGMASVMSALNVAYGVEEARPWWKQRLLAIVLTMGFCVFVLLALAFMVFGPHLGSAAAARFGFGEIYATAWSLASIPLALLFALVGVALVYYFAPAVDQDWRWLTPGSTFTLVVWLVMSFGLRQYVARFNTYNATYGSIGGVILLLLWLYLSSIVLLVGAEINSEIEHAAADRGAADAKAEGERHAA
jgi:membrane protein